MKELGTKLTIKEWSEADRPREKMKIYGRQSLSDAELLAILIGSGTQDDNAVSIAQKLLQSVNFDLNKLSKLTLKELQKQPGIGDAKSLLISASLELGIRRKDKSPEQLQKVQNSTEIQQLMGPHFTDLSHEEFWVIYLNRGNRILQKKCLSKGGISGTVVDIRLILRGALECLASAIIICHNHPSGNLQPSIEDLHLTQKCKEAISLLDMRLLDHLIIFENSYYSFSDEGQL